MQTQIVTTLEYNKKNENVFDALNILAVFILLLHSVQQQLWKSYEAVQKLLPYSVIFLTENVLRGKY